MNDTTARLKPDAPDTLRVMPNGNIQTLPCDRCHKVGLHEDVLEYAEHIPAGQQHLPIVYYDSAARNGDGRHYCKPCSDEIDAQIEAQITSDGANKDQSEMLAD